MARARPYSPGRVLTRFFVIFGAIVMLVVVLSNFQDEIGLAEPGPSCLAAVAAAAEVDRSLEAAEDYDDFSAVLRVALVARRNIVVANPAEVELDHLLSRALELYEAARVAWQADLEGLWETESLDDPAYWQATHPELTVNGSDLTPDEIRESCRRQAAEHLRRALDLVAR